MKQKLLLMTEIWGLLSARGKLWLLPLVLVLLLIASLLVFAQTSALAPLIYTLF